MTAPAAPKEPPVWLIEIPAWTEEEAKEKARRGDFDTITKLENDE